MTRALPISILAAAAFAGGIAAGAHNELEAVDRFAAAWEREDYAAMYDELSPAAAADVSQQDFEAAYEQAGVTATLDGVDTAPAESGSTPQGDDAAIVEITAQTHAWGEVVGDVAIPVSDGRVAWAPHLVFPGLAEGEQLARQTRAPPRASILAADGTPLAEGPAAARSSPLGVSASAVTGSMDTARGDVATDLEAEGFPPQSLTGSSGLELAFNDRLDGQPSGQLFAVERGEEPEQGRQLATGQPRPGRPVETTLDPDLQQAAVLALGDLFGGVAALDARDGSVLALAGIAFSAPQPPGSTFKVITTSAALEEGLVTPNEEFPVETAAVIDGREVANAHDELCGGTFTQSFAKSCNSVFAPLGVEVGAERLVAEAEEYGFNAEPELYNEEAVRAVAPPESTIPPADEIGTDLDVGVSAIGQGEVLATPLQLASVSQTVANGGVRSPTPITKDRELRPDAKPVEVMDPETARTLRELMIEVVNSGTGTAAAVDGVQVAGKTGTAELGPKPLEEGDELGPGEEPEQEVDAWFTGFAPASQPTLAVAAMVVNADGDGGVVAAPIVSQVLDAGL
jgi:cell division protein FtsI/penicillin-binding protein 2